MRASRSAWRGAVTGMAIEPPIIVGGACGAGARKVEPAPRSAIEARSEPALYRQRTRSGYTGRGLFRAGRGSGDRRAHERPAVRGSVVTTTRAVSGSAEAAVRRVVLPPRGDLSASGGSGGGGPPAARRDWSVSPNALGGCVVLG